MTLLPINKIQKVEDSVVRVDQVNFKKDSLSGDIIDGGKITNFKSTGIKDEANDTRIVIKDDCVEVASDLYIKGTVKVENLQYVQAQVPKLNVTKAVMVDDNEVI